MRCSHACRGGGPGGLRDGGTGAPFARKESSPFHYVAEAAMGVVLLVILALLLVGAVPAYPYNRGWGY
jgi:hypothetical protein